MANQITNFFIVLVFFSSCGTTSIVMDSITIVPRFQKENTYHPSKKREVDLIHTALDVRFDWEKEYVLGKASLTIEPYFYPLETLYIDAKGFEIHGIYLEETKRKELIYKYNKERIFVDLKKKYKKGEQFIITIDYTAKPSKKKNKIFSPAEDQGLYFINSQGLEKNKPQQIWTQGETEYNSCWFPTVDSPNERMTQKISITVQEKFSTLSNGILVNQIKNNDGTRTDYWEQKKAHAPYLTMLAVGEFATIDQSNPDLLINYYIEEEYEGFAKDIFGLTPEMINFYSDILNVEYPWEKYSQIIVRDFISGAMENTGAVVYGEFLHQSPIEMIDGNYEDFIAHELFHHWFGNLVTCESWANLPLNESFATYGEYLWFEHKHGKDEADLLLYNFLEDYIEESKNKKVDLIRFNYKDKEEMFDSHSYSKGGCILHMLRKYVGDEAFFASLQRYLEENKYKSVEIHNLRLAFEETTGEDLNWFFKQWFLSKGHPLLQIEKNYNKTQKIVTIKVTQEQDFNQIPLYKIPLSIEIHTTKVQQERIVIQKKEEIFSFAVESEPKWVSFDSQKIVLCEKKESKLKEEWAYQFVYGNNFIDKKEALEGLTQTGKKTLLDSIITKALSDSFWKIKEQALEMLLSYSLKEVEIFIPMVKKMAFSDKSSHVRAQAIRTLSKIEPHPTNTEEYKKCLRDSSVLVLSEVLYAMLKIDKNTALSSAHLLAPKAEKDLNRVISNIFSEEGKTKKEQDFLVKQITELNRDDQEILFQYAAFLKNFDYSYIINNLTPIINVAKKGVFWQQRITAIQILRSFQQTHFSKADDVLKEKLKKIIEEIKRDETDDNIKRMLEFN